MDFERKKTKLHGSEKDLNLDKEAQWNQAAQNVQELKAQLSSEHKEAENINEALAEKLARGEMSAEEARDQKKYKPELDEGIDEILIALRAYGINTFTSCKGHPEKISGRVTKVPYRDEHGQVIKDSYTIYNVPSRPYVSTGLSAPDFFHWPSGIFTEEEREAQQGTSNWEMELRKGEPFTEEEKITRRQRNEVLRSWQKTLNQLLEEFYEGRPNIPGDVRLVSEFADASTFFGPKLTHKGPFSTETMASLSMDELRGKIIACQKEVDDFAQFMKEGFFSK